MAFVAAIPAMTAAIGGGSMVAGAATLAAAAATVYTGVRSAQESKRAGKFAQAESEIEARAEGDAARQREIERKKTLMRAIASRAAYAGAGGIRTDVGSQAALVNIDVADARSDDNIDAINSSSRQRALRIRGQNARDAGKSQAASTLIDTAVRTYQSFGRK